MPRLHPRTRLHRALRKKDLYEILICPLGDFSAETLLQPGSLVLVSNATVNVCPSLQPLFGEKKKKKKTAAGAVMWWIM